MTLPFDPLFGDHNWALRLQLAMELILCVTGWGLTRAIALVPHL